MAEATHPDAATVVLVHGAFADESSWSGGITRWQSKGVPVTAPANPLHGITVDAAYIASVLAQIEGRVVAVGHSYGGAPHPEPDAYAAKFSGWYSHRTLVGGIGHNLPQEAPDASPTPCWNSIAGDEPPRS